MLKKIRVVLAVVFWLGITLLLLDFTGALHGWLGWMAKVQFLPAVLALNVAVIIGLILLFFVNKKPHRNPYIVVLSCQDHTAEQAAMQYLNARTERCVVKSKSAQRGLIELNLEVRLKDDDTDFVNELSAMPNVNSAVLVSYNGEYAG